MVGSYICGNTNAGKILLKFRIWYCEPKIKDRASFAECVLSEWKNGQPVLESRYEDHGITRSQTECIEGGECFNIEIKSFDVDDLFQQPEQSNKRANYLEVLNLLKQNKIEEAQNKISSLLKQNPNEADYYNLNALLETLKKNTSAAQQNYEKAIKLDPKNILAYLGSAKLALDGGQLDKAKELANQALAINNKAINAYLVLADVAYKQKDNAEVEKLLLTAKEKVKGDLNSEIEVIKSLGKFYGLEKQPEKILSLIEDLEKRYPNNSIVLNLLGFRRK